MKQNLFPKQVNDILKPVKVITAIALDLLEKKTEKYLTHFSAFLKIKKNRNFNIFSHSKMLSKSSRNLVNINIVISIRYRALARCSN